jgi:hypothetical protein
VVVAVLVLKSFYIFTICMYVHRYVMCCLFSLVSSIGLFTPTK